jgi:hypothetical protein
MNLKINFQIYKYDVPALLLEIQIQIVLNPRSISFFRIDSLVWSIEHMGDESIPITELIWISTSNESEIFMAE